jgi:hypothetical protein
VIKCQHLHAGCAVWQRHALANQPAAVMRCSACSFERVPHMLSLIILPACLSACFPVMCRPRWSVCTTVAMPVIWRPSPSTGGSGTHTRGMWSPSWPRCMPLEAWAPWCGVVRCAWCGCTTSRGLSTVRHTAGAHRRTTLATSAATTGGWGQGLQALLDAGPSYVTGCGIVGACQASSQAVACWLRLLHGPLNADTPWLERH